jgi:hypothetical protein
MKLKMETLRFFTTFVSTVCISVMSQNGRIFRSIDIYHMFCPICKMCPIFYSFFAPVLLYIRLG